MSDGRQGNSSGGGSNKRPDPASRLRAEQAQDKHDKEKESNKWLVRMIYLMATLFVVTVFELDGVFYACVAFAAQLLGSVFDNAPNWVSAVKGSMNVILIGGFAAATAAARYLARVK